MKNIYEGLKILLKYESDGDCAAEHDILYAGDSASEKDMTVEDKNKMEELGWMLDEEFDCWSTFT